MGGLINKVYTWLVKKPIRTGSLAALLSSPYSAYTLITGDYSAPADSLESISFIASIMTPMLVLPSVGIATELLQTFAYEDKYHPRTRLSDFKKRKLLKEAMSYGDFESLVEQEFNLQKQGTLKTAVKDKQNTFSDTEKNADKIAALAEKEQDPHLHADAVIRYFKHGKYDAAFIQLDKLFKLGKALPDLYKADFAMNTFANKLDLFLNPRNPAGLLYAAMLSALKQDFEGAFYYSTFAKKTAELFKSPIKNEIYCLDALIHHALRAKNSKAVWYNFIREIRKEPALERIAETKNPVRILKSSPFLSKTVVFKDNPNPSDLEAEIEMTHFIGSQLSDDCTVAEPLYLSESPIDGEYTCVMRHVAGETLLSQFKKKDYSALTSIVDCLAQIHALVPVSKVRKGKLDIADKVQNKLIDIDLNLPEDISDRLIRNYLPVLDSFKDATYVYNKDAHPENWLVNGKQIVVLDCENGFLVPQQFDLANLLDYSHYLTDTQKDEAITAYVIAYEKYTCRTVNMDKFRLTYFNSVIQRAISLSTAWSSEDRPAMHSERQNVLFNAIHAIDRIKREHRSYHSKYKSYYLSILQSLNAMHELVSVKCYS